MAVVLLDVHDLRPVLELVRWHLYPDQPPSNDPEYSLLEVVSALLMLRLGLEHEAEYEQSAPVLNFIYMDDLTEMIDSILSLPLIRIVCNRPILRVEVHNRQGTLAFYH